MFIEIHAIQNFAPSNLNRDDTGSPKDCEFGGFRRARVSSQCWKRAVRMYFRSEELFPADQLAVRTKRLVTEIVARLRKKKSDVTDAHAEAVARAAVKTLVGGKADEKAEKAKAVKAAKSAKLGAETDSASNEVSTEDQAPKSDKTNVLLFLGNDQIDSITTVCIEHWDELLKKPTDKVVKRIKECLDGSKAVDLALFGRMIAEAPDSNVDASCQVAHALSTHGVAPEFDYYTAVDDLNPKEDTGAGMIGALEFNSACFYRYANIDVTSLTSNLLNDDDLAQKAVHAFLQSFVRAIPKAKQNSSAAQSLPSFVMVVVGEKGLNSLVNAFAKPVNGKGDGLIVNSIHKLESYWSNIIKAYGDTGIRYRGYFTTEDLPLVEASALTLENSLANLIAAAHDSLQKST